MVPLIFLAVLPTTVLVGLFVYAACRLAGETDDASECVYQASRRDDEV